MAYHDSHDDGLDVYVRCDECRTVDLEVCKCEFDDCPTQIHETCGVKCEACKKIVCGEHARKFDDLDFCPVCHHTFLLEQQLEKEAEMELERSPA